MAFDFRPDRAFPALGAEFADPVDPADFPHIEERFWNRRWAREIGLDGLGRDEKIEHFARFAPLPGWTDRPLAMRYHGHQFRQYNPQIGDGRGFLYAQMRDPAGRLLDFGTKGSGQTPWSRSGDGRLTLKGAVREILAAQVLEALGVYTSKAFAVFETGDQLHRHDEPSPARGAVLTRLQHSHVRFGTFQRQAYAQNTENLTALVDHCIAAYYPALDDREGEERPLALLNEILAQSARLAGEWMAAGFVHGVLNTDNLNVTGESFDYGPWRFLPYFEPSFTAAYFDEHGLYAFARQPEAVFWALQQLGAALSLIVPGERLVEVLNTFPERYRASVGTAFTRRLGIRHTEGSSQDDLIRAALTFLMDSRAPWEAFFFDHFAKRDMEAPDDRRALYAGEPYDAFRTAFDAFEAERPERLNHPYFRRSDPVHMTIEQMEASFAPIHEHDDWSAFHTLLGDIAEVRAGYDLGAGRVGFLPEETK